MKYLTLTIAVFISLSCFAQSDVQKKEINKPLAEYKKNGQWVAELKKHIIQGDTIYMLLYRDSQYEHIMSAESFYMQGINNMKQFFALIKSMYDNKKDPNDEYVIHAPLNTEITITWLKNDIMLLVKDRNGSYTSLVMPKVMLDKLNVL